MALAGSQFMYALDKAAPTLKKNGKSLIILWMSGGPSTIDLWDLKPGHANGGQFKPIATAASGVQISEHLPTVAKQFKNLSIIRSLTTSEGDHMRGTYLMNTGRSPNPIVQFPAMGSVAARLLSNKDLDLPAFISVGGGGGSRVGPGFLGMTYAPFTVQNPGQLPENVAAPQGLDQARMERRKNLFGAIESDLKTGVASDSVKAHNDIYAKAFKLSVSDRRQVFQFDAKDNALITKYGNNNFGKGCLLARKLVEAGATAVEVDLGGWDNHQQVFNALHTTQGTGRADTLDKGMGALVEDLVDRKMLKDTVIVWMGEFGRTPKINQNTGRDHFPRVWSVVVGGGNIKGGQVYGSTDAGGEAVKDNPVNTLSLFATVYKALGIDPTPETNASVRDNLGRPYYIAGDKPQWIKELLV
jgi:hypothetical protein